MPAERRNRASPANTTVWACTECKRRKGKCSGETPCAFCQKANRTCTYEARPVRLPLTRKNLDYLQARCAKLETLLRTLDPSIDIDTLLSSPDCNSSDDGDIAAEQYGDGDLEEMLPESENVCGFEWHEREINELSDGMASLNVDSRDVGYLGTSSGAALLRTVHRLISRQSDSPQPLLLTPTPSISRIAQSLTTTLTASLLIDAYFEHYHPSYPLIHEPSFRNTCNNLNTLPPSSSFRLVYGMALTLGAFTAYDGSNSDEMDVDMRIWTAVRGGLSMASILESGTLERVQALAMMGQYLQKRDRPNTGYNMMGTAVRMGFGLGLHHEGYRCVSETLGREHRRRVWWLLYIFDVGASITFGRPAVVSDRASTRIPVNVDDAELTSPTSPLPPATSGITTYTAMIAHASLVRLAARIHSYLISRQYHNQLSRELIHAFDTQIHTWHASLPPFFTTPASTVPAWFREPRAVVLWKELNLRMIMYKRFLPLLQKGKRQLPDRDAAICISLALETIASVREYVKTETLRRGVAWYCTYFVFQAALVLVIAVLKTEEQEAVWAEGLESAEVCLDAARGCLGDGAGRCLDVLRRVGRLWSGGDEEVVLEGSGNLLVGMEEWSGGIGVDGLGIEGIGGFDAAGAVGLEGWMSMADQGYEDLLDANLFTSDT
ncbi:uncharacterized protein H6S33_006295 [Morchella sextelata]|uniref:uncharacterized protein n=1 Tax=Morchella sextelata TaxID=1174677 RepID=UPI001D03F606|nr:uncharacterized protein H6S33_006295 [Morchella sextelata]KAH0604627.1 hypothetical protein H6S33_006295 [Morchella sextelata]